MNILSILIFVTLIIYVLSQTETIIPLTSLSYGVTEVRVSPGFIIDLFPKVSGTARTYSITPELPTGSKINKDNGYIELTSGATGMYTVTVSNDDGSLTTSFNVTSGGLSVLPVRFFKLGYYDNYEFAVGFPVDLPVYIEGVPVRCVMSGGEIPGLTFDLNGLHGTPTQVSNNRLTLSFYCINGASRTNLFTITTQVHSEGKNGLIGNFWKWSRYRLAFPCDVLTNAFSTPFVNLESRKVMTSFSISSDSYFSFNRDFNEFYGVTFTGYIKIPSMNSYTFATISYGGSYIKLDGQMAVNNMNSCSNYYIVTGTPLFLFPGYHSIEIGYRRYTSSAYAKFYINLGGVNTEILSTDFYYVPLNVIQYDQQIVSFPLGSPASNQLYLYDVTVKSCTVEPSSLPSGLSLDSSYNIVGTPNVLTTFADLIYVLKCISTDDQELLNTFYIEVRNYNLPAIPYIALKRGKDRKVNVNPDMYFQLGWQIDHSCYPSMSTLYWSISAAPNSLGSANCYGSGRSLSCYLRLSSATTFSAQFDPGTEYDQSYQIPGTVYDYFEKAEFILIGKINNDASRSTSLRISFTATKVTPIPGWVYFEVWILHYPKTTSFSSRVNGRCGKYTVFDKNNQPILDLDWGFEEWLNKQGLLLEPNEYSIKLDISYEHERSTCQTIHDAYYNITIDTKSTLYLIKWGQLEYVSFTVRKMECPASLSDNLPSKAVGDSVVFDCDEGQVGKRTRLCSLESSGQPYWAPEVSTCRPLITMTYLDYGISSVDIPINYKYILKPKTDGDYDKFTFSMQPVGSSKFDEKTGVIELLSSSEITSYSSLTITASQTGGSTISITIKFKFITFATGKLFEPVENLYLYPTSKFNFAVNTKTSIFFKSTGLIENCQVTPQIPQGLNLGINFFEGKPTTVSYNIIEYTVQCSNLHSTSSTLKFKASVLPEPSRNGLTAFYWYSKGNQQLLCDSKYEAGFSDGLVTGSERIEKTIQHELVESGRWSNLGPRFTDYWGASFYGYIKLPTLATYTFRLESQHGSWLEIDDELLSSAPGCRLMNATSNSTSKQFESGFHSIKILYFHNGGPSGLKIYWKYGTNAERLIPNDQFYYVIPSVFGYTNQISNYVLGATIDNNEVMTIGEVQSGSCKISPSNLYGLSFNADNGMISGATTISTDGVSVSRTVSCLISVAGIISNYSTIIFIDIIDYSLPYNVKVRRQGGYESIKELHLVLGESVVLLTTSEGNATSYIEMSSPISGFSLNTLTGEYSGKCSNSFSQSVVIAARNNAGISSYEFSIICSDECSTGMEQFLIKVPDFLKIKKNLIMSIANKNTEEIILTQTIINPAIQPIIGLCLPVNVIYIFSGANYNPNSLTIDVSMGANLMNSFYIQGSPDVKQFTYDIHFNLLPPTITFPREEYTFFIPSTILIVPKTEFIISRCSVIPALFSGLILDKKTCSISGSLSVISSLKSFTVVASNGAGDSNNAIISIEVKDCGSEGKVSYLIEYSTGLYPEQNIWSFETADHAEIASGSATSYPLNNNTYYISGCAPSSTYNFRLRHSSVNQAWHSSASIKISIGGNPGIVLTKSTAETEQVIEVTVDLVLSSAAQWKIRATQIPTPNWFNLPYSQLSGFTIDVLNNAPPFSGATIYLSTEFSPSTSMDYAAFRLNLTHEYGIIAYLNGMEFYRRFLPKTDVSYNTYATNQFERATLISIILPSLHLLLNQANTLSIEIHRLSTSSDQLLLSASAVRINDIIDGCVMVSKLYSEISETSDNSSPDKPPINALDYDIKTEWYEYTTKQSTSIKPYIEFKFKDNQYVLHNQFGFVTIPEEGSVLLNNHPNTILLYGYDGDNWELLNTISNINVQLEGQKFTYHNFNGNKVYNGFKFVIDKMKSVNSDLRISDIFVGSCYKYYCSPLDGFPTTSSGSKASAPCPNGYVGTQFNQCGEGVNPSWGTSDQSRCRPSPPTNLKYPLNLYVFTSFSDIKEKIIPTISFIGSLYYESIPELPSGVSIDHNNGTIYGTPGMKTPLSKYIIRATDKSSESGSEFELSIEVTSNFCPQDGKWPATQGGDIAQISCDVGYIGFKLRLCMDGPTPTWDIVDNDDCIDARTKNNVNIPLVVTLSVLSFVAVVAIVACIYARCRSSRRRSNSKTAIKKKDKKMARTVKL